MFATSCLYSCSNDKSVLEKFKEKKQNLFALDSVINIHFDSIYHYYLPSQYANLSIITSVHLLNDSIMKNNPIIFHIQSLMNKLNVNEIIISENKEILILDTIKSNSLNTEKYYWVSSKSANLSGSIVSRLKLKQVENFQGSKFYYYISLSSIAE